ncbi:hypothetical protein ACJX0J_032041 [Zea mays]
MNHLYSCLCLCFIWDSHFGFPNISLSFFLLEENMEPILCTQPRRFAVVTIARVIAESHNWRSLKCVLDSVIKTKLLSIICHDKICKRLLPLFSEGAFLCNLGIILILAPLEEQIFEFKDARKIKESYNCQIWYSTFYYFPFLVSFLFAVVFGMIHVDPYYDFDELKHHYSMQTASQFTTAHIIHSNLVIICLKIHEMLLGAWGTGAARLYHIAFFYHYETISEEKKLFVLMFQHEIMMFLQN